MSNTGRVPLWLLGFVGGFAAITVLSLFIYGSYSGLGSSL